MKAAGAIALVLALFGLPVLAEAPLTSARPEARVAAEVEAIAVLRPVARTNGSDTQATRAAPLADPEVTLALIDRTEAVLSSRSAPVPMTAAQPLGLGTPNQLARLALPRPVPREGTASDAPAPVETVTALIARGELDASADLPLASFMAKTPGGIAALRPLPATEAVAAPMGLILVTPAAAVQSPRPLARQREDRSYVTRAQYRANQNVFAFSPLATPFSMRPLLRPAALTQRAEEARAAILRGSVCGVAEIQGEAIGDVPGPGSCGIDNAVRLRSVAGITFSGEAPRVDCDTARALNRWLQRSAIPTLSDRGGGLSQLSIMGTYSCRNRNGASSGRLSEHAFGRAFDIGGFKLRDGTTFTVLRDWGSRAWGDTLKTLHRAACGPFGTVLGPNANAAHRNHFHFDTAGYRSGSYCR